MSSHIYLFHGSSQLILLLQSTNGTVHKYNITSGTWTDISPTSLATTYYGYGGLSVDLQVPGTLMVAALNVIILYVFTPFEADHT